MFRFVEAKIGNGQLLYFPADGIAALPMIGAIDAAPGTLLLPTTLNTFFAGVHQGGLSLALPNAARCRS
jgi:hypothetical protein